MIMKLVGSKRPLNASNSCSHGGFVHQYLPTMLLYPAIVGEMLQLALEVHDHFGFGQIFFPKPGNGRTTNAGSGRLGT